MAEGYGAIPKQAVLYVRDKSRTDYRCDQCMMFVPDKQGCTIHTPDTTIKAHGSCGLWVAGEPQPGAEIHGHLTPKETGYEENQPGFSCKRCIYFSASRKDCYVVDKDSEGTDPGIIHPDACCNYWRRRRP